MGLEIHLQSDGGQTERTDPGYTLITYRIATQPADGVLYRMISDGKTADYACWFPNSGKWVGDRDAFDAFAGGKSCDYITAEEADLAVSGGRVGLAELLSRYYHRGQKDKAGNDYAAHPAAVAAKLETEDEKIVAFLHDTLEDTDMEPWIIRRRFGDSVLSAVQALTRGEEESYEEFIVRCGKNPLARRVKLADLEHNMDLSRLPEITEADRKRLEKYQRATAYLKGIETE